MYSIRPDRPLDPVIREILESVRGLARLLGYAYILVGATARDMLMNHVFGIASRRATHDVDFAIALQDWQSFDLLRAALIDSGRFAPAQSKAHLLYYRPDEHGKAYPLDIIPFGELEKEAHQIAWPPDMNVVMNVTGYREALDTALQVDLGEGLIVPVVSIPALASLKLLSWNDRGLADDKDAKDLYFLFQHYADAGNHDRLYDEAFPLLEACAYDLTAAGAALLGQDSRVCLHDDSLQSLLAVLANPQKRDRLIVHMARAAAGGAQHADRLLSEFERGLHRARSST